MARKRAEFSRKSLDEMARHVAKSVPGTLSIEDRSRRGDMGNYAILHSEPGEDGKIERLPTPVSNMTHDLTDAFLWGMLAATELLSFPALQEEGG